MRSVAGPCGLWRARSPVRTDAAASASVAPGEASVALATLVAATLAVVTLGMRIADVAGPVARAPVGALAFVGLVVVAAGLGSASVVAWAARRATRTGTGSAPACDEASLVAMPVVLATAGATLPPAVGWFAWAAGAMLAARSAACFTRHVLDRTGADALGRTVLLTLGAVLPGTVAIAFVHATTLR
ncbi:MAG: hypothetical protein NZ898_07005 [Myxococcota bacterium]|nr:hypothetical protein [Myxococcota bacterium]MDW8361891.1 hypothetical protein [Myxococcales bacterium]